MREGRHREDPPSFGEGNKQSYSFMLGTPSPSHTERSALPRVRLDMNNLPHRNHNARPAPAGLLREGAHRMALDLPIAQGGLDSMAAAGV